MTGPDDELRTRQRADRPRSFAETPVLTEEYALAELRRYREMYPNVPPEVPAFGLLRQADQWYEIQNIEAALTTMLKEAAGTDPMPVFTFTANDRLAHPALKAYREACASYGLHEQAAEVREAMEEMVAWQNRNPEAMTWPEGDETAAFLSALAAGYRRGLREGDASRDPSGEGDAGPILSSGPQAGTGYHEE